MSNISDKSGSEIERRLVASNFGLPIVRLISLVTLFPSRFLPLEYSLLKTLSFLTSLAFVCSLDEETGRNKSPRCTSLPAASLLEEAVLGRCGRSNLKTPEAAPGGWVLDPSNLGENCCLPSALFSRRRSLVLSVELVPAVGTCDELNCLVRFL